MIVGKPPTPLSAAFFVLRISTFDASNSGLIGGSGSPGLSSVGLLLDDDDGLAEDMVDAQELFSDHRTTLHDAQEIL